MGALVWLRYKNMRNKNNKNGLVSVIVSTYNQPVILGMILSALNEQDCDHSLFEVVVADDGSTDETSSLVTRLKEHLSFCLKHVWHEDLGFRLSAIRNKAVAASSGDYLIFLDGDCIPQKSFVRRHLYLAEPGWFVAGSRVLLSKDFTAKVCKEKIPLQHFSIFDWMREKILRKNCGRFLPFLSLPTRLPFGLSWVRKIQAKKWRGAKSCNLAMWKDDFLSVDGFDESFIGWGYDDADLVCRLMKRGVLRKKGNFAVTVIHLWHENAARDNEKENYARFIARLNQG